MKERREAVRKYILEKGEVTLDALAERFPEWSVMTLRRDLEYLEGENTVIRTHGGARANPAALYVVEGHYLERESDATAAKEEIALKACSLINEHSGIFIDSGTTAMAFARRLPDINLVVVTTGPNIALELASKKKNPIVTVAGGILSGKTIAISGPACVEQIGLVNIETAFLAASGYSPETGFATGSLPECEVKRAVLKRAQRRVLLMDSGKIGRHLPYTFARTEDIDIVITDAGAGEDFRAELEKAGVRVM